MVQVIHEVIVPLRPNLNFPKNGKPTLVHVHLFSNSNKIQVIEVKHGKKLNINKYHPFIVDYIESSVKEAMTMCSSRYWVTDPEVTTTSSEVIIDDVELAKASYSAL